ncbi:MAG: hypothetical protein ACI4PF_03535 [Christensenellales bacterium]
MDNKQMKNFMDSIPTFSQMERVRVFNKCGLSIRQVGKGVFFEYIKLNKERYCAMVFNPTHYEKELKKVKDYLKNNILLRSAK